MRKSFLNATFLSLGFSALIAQLILMRELGAVFFGNELFLGISLSLWLLCVAAGSFTADRLSLRSNLALILILIAAVLPVQIILVRSIKNILGIQYGELVGLVPMLYSTLFILLPSCLLFGAAFVLASKIKDGASVYILESIGSFIGGALFTFILIQKLGHFKIAFLIAMINAALACLLRDCPQARPSTIQRGLSPCGEASHSLKVKLFPISAAILIAAVFLFLNADTIDKKTREFQWQKYNLIDEANSVYGHLALTKTDTLVSLFENSIISSTMPNEEFYEELVHWPMLAHKNPRDVLIIGPAVTGALREILKHTPQKIDNADLDPASVELAKKYLPFLDAQAATDARVKIFSNIDGVKFIKRSKTKYDVIILNVPEPSNAQINRFYTIEFFSALRKILKEGGIVSISVQSAENYLIPQKRLLNASIYKTLSSIFPNIFIIPGGKTILLASQSKDIMALDAQAFASRLKSRRIENNYIGEYYFPFKLTKERVDFAYKNIGVTKSVKPNRDFAPSCYYYSLLVWRSQFASPLNILNEILLLVLVFYLLRLFINRRHVIKSYLAAKAVFSIGALGITLELILILAYQAVYGYIWQNMGILFGTFMLGLSLGSFFMNLRIVRRKSKKTDLAKLLVVSSLFAFTMPVILNWLSLKSVVLRPDLIYATFIALMAVTGSLVGAVFPEGLRLHLRKGEAGFIYAVDLAGSAVAGIAASIFLFPLLGFTSTCILAGITNLILNGGVFRRT